MQSLVISHSTTRPNEKSLDKYLVDNSRFDETRRKEILKAAYKNKKQLESS